MKIRKSLYTHKDGVFSFEKFYNPSMDYAPIYSWVWNDVLSKEEIIRQLDEMQELGIQAFYIIPEPKTFRPKTMPTNLEPDYLTDDYMQFYRFTMDEAAKRKMAVWLYDEGGWPSGGACGKVLSENPTLAKRTLEIKRSFYKKGAIYKKPEDVFATFIKGNIPLIGSPPYL